MLKPLKEHFSSDNQLFNKLDLAITILNFTFSYFTFSYFTFSFFTDKKGTGNFN
jgi:hypothetical protein